MVDVVPPAIWARPAATIGGTIAGARKTPPCGVKCTPSLTVRITTPYTVLAYRPIGHAALSRSSTETVRGWAAAISRTIRL